MMVPLKRGAERVDMGASVSRERVVLWRRRRGSRAASRSSDCAQRSARPSRRVQASSGSESCEHAVDDAMELSACLKT